MGNDSNGRQPPGGMSPYDTPASAALRFVTELIAWVAGPWAVASATGIWWLAIPTAVILIGAVSVFSTPGDKHTVVVATPGPVRLALELVLAAVAVVGAWVAWPVWIALIVTVVVAGSVLAGARRARWLARGAPPVR